MSLILIGGGARSGKSKFAVGYALEQGEDRVFIATAQAYDDEMRTRIAAHQAERSGAFRTIEAPLDLPTAFEDSLASAPDVIVIDCLTLWMSNRLLAEHQPAAILDSVVKLAAAADDTRVPVLLVTNEVGMGIVPMSALGRTFRDLAGGAHQRLAARADEVWFAAMGMMLRLAPSPVQARPLPP